MAEREVQRRLAAILAADVAGYTRLMETDTDGTVEAWQDAREDVIRPRVSDHSGKIVKLTGDGFLVEFPTVQDAVNCAIAMQQGLADSSLNFRMGVNLGDIVDDGEDIHGEGVNLAARLEGLAEPGGIVISGGVYDQVKNRIDADYEDMGLQKVKNVSAPVQAYRVRQQKMDGDAAAPRQGITTEVFDRPAVAVLPFDNMSGDEEQEYFADGITEDIITELAKWGWFPVIARNSTFAYKGQSPDIRKVADELGARYVVEGSVRKSGNRVRITAQLIDAVTGHHVWAERYDRDLTDVFAVQDEITMNLAGAIMPELSVEQQKLALRKPPENLEAWDLLLRAQWNQSQFARESFVEARRLLLEAEALDSEMSMVHAMIADIALWSLTMNWLDNPIEGLAEANEHVTKALALDPGNAHAHACMAWCVYYTGQPAEAQREGEAAVEINPSYAVGRMYIGNMYVFLGQPDAAIEQFGMVRRLSPRDPLTFVTDAFEGLANHMLGNFDEAVDFSRKAIRKNPDFLYPYFNLAASCGELGQMDEAKEALTGGRRLQPEPSEEFFRTAWPYVSQVDMENFLEGLQKAGLSVIE